MKTNQKYSLLYFEPNQFSVQRGSLNISNTLSAVCYAPARCAIFSASWFYWLVNK